MKGIWADGSLYEGYVGRWSRLVARQFVPWLGVRRDADWLDVGCGTGALTQAILDLAWPRAVTGVEPSEGFLKHARERIKGVRFEVGEAQELPFDPDSFDAVGSGLVLNFVPDPARMATEMRRVTRPGATAGLYVWDYAGEMQLLRRFFDAAVELDPAAAEHDEGRRFPICRPEPLARLFAEAGFRDVQTRALDVPTVFRDFDDVWTPFLSGQGPAPAYCVSLPEERRSALRERLREKLPISGDGSIRLLARAWAVQGRA